MRKFTLCMLACCAVAASSYAQDVPVNREKYPDYVEPQKAYKPEPRLMKYLPVAGEAMSRAARSAASDLPDHWNNAETKFFPPVFNQAGGSCGSASRICYMFTHEINSLRNLDGKTPENYYPSHFVWLHTSGNDGKNEFVEFVGVPNAKVYGGQTYSSLFGYQEETDNDYGWMQGYDKWMNAISNRMMAPTSMPQSVQSEAGRLAAKAWLYNHAGDTDFKAGGLIGLGVASGGQWYEIPQTDANDAAGVTGMYYVHRWGTQVDHAVTMVGWDDRIEFDLDGNGVAGEKSKDEVGAWIIVNSWGDWCNGGFIYCPYKYAGPVSDPETGAMTGGYWWGELYHARKNFRPLRVLKVKMDYTHRSELLLQAGISTDLNATAPESVTDLHHFRYAGDGGNGDVTPAPATPMLGKWLGKWHEEPMEFCYDLTDLSSKYDTNKPLKYFFIIKRKNETSSGEGSVYEASLLDLERDLDGIETPFDLGGEKFTITKQGDYLIMSSVVYGAGYEPVTNLALSDGVLAWDAPIKSSYALASYNIYKDGQKIGNTTEQTYAVEGGQEYAVTALYTDGTESDKITCTVPAQRNQVACSFEYSGFTIPNIFDNHYTDCTIEFYIYPTRFVDWNCEAGPGWGTYMQHFNALYDYSGNPITTSGTFTCGWNTNARLTSNVQLQTNTWYHMAIVVRGGSMSLFIDGKAAGSVYTSLYNGLGGFGDLVFNASGATSAQNAKYDEIRIWDHARSNKEILGSNTVSVIRHRDFFGEVMPQGLLAYYKGDTFLGADGRYYMRDYVGTNHAPIYANGDPQTESSIDFKNSSISSALKINAPEGEVYAGVPVALTATHGESINKIVWSVPASGISGLHAISPTVVFPETGTYKCYVEGTNYNGAVTKDSIDVVVTGAPAIDATFTMSATNIPCSEHLSLIASNYMDACSYEWILPGAEVEKAYGAKAGATYVEAGDYTVTLKITMADGRIAESSQEVQVTAVAPKADFMIEEAVVLKGTPVLMSSTSRYGATDYEWTLEGEAQKTTIKEGLKEQTWVPKYPGKYNVSLKASNTLGSNKITKERALIVTNDDSKNGLSFSQPASTVTLTNAVPELKGFAVDFWAYPLRFSTSCWSMGDSEETLLLKVGNYGEMSVYVNDTVVTSEPGFFIADEWNHYAVIRNNAGAISFERNGVRFGVCTPKAKGAIKGIKKFAIGGADAPVYGVIDEFRLWGSLVSPTLMKTLCNQRMANPEEYVQSHNLLAYYDFDQSGGDVIDRSGNGNTGVRTGFGPDGDAWGLSKGVFSLYLDGKLDDETITGIDEVGMDEPISAGRKGVYTLSGQYLGNTIEGLPAGVYIVDGKKVALQ